MKRGSRSGRDGAPEQAAAHLYTRRASRGRWRREPDGNAMYQIFVVEDELLIRQNIRSIIENMQAPYAFCPRASRGTTVRERPDAANSSNY